MFKSPGEIAIKIGLFQIHWYGIIICIAFYTGLFIMLRLCKKFGLSRDNVYDVSFYSLFGALLGARAYYCLVNLRYFMVFPQELIMIWNGGISIHGAILGGLITLSVYAKKNNINLLRLTDLFSIGLVIGQSIGRWGNFFNSEAFGKPTDLPWKLFIPVVKRPIEYINYQYFHPTFLYESIWDLFIFIILLFFVLKNKNLKIGFLTFFYFLFYSIGRAFIELLRVDSVYSPYNIPIAFTISLFLIIVGSIGLIFVNLYGQKYKSDL
jgi:phosphatidylglycerol:prolipoprotein diacylglycerol transferase